MSPLGIFFKLIAKLPAILDAVDAVGKRITHRPPRPTDAPPPSIDLPDNSPIYKDEHNWTRFGPHLPPQSCIYCKQPMNTASRYCPGVAKKVT